MAKIVKVTDGNYKVIVSNGATGTITLDTTAGASTVQGTTVINGNLEVKGTTTTVESTVTTIADNIITLNEGEAGAGVSASVNYISGIEVDRGSFPAARLVFNEQTAFETGGSSGTGAWKFQDINGATLPITTNSINAEGTLYITTPTSYIDVAGTVNYERNIFNYAFDAVLNDFKITDPGGGPTLQSDGLVNAKAVVDYVTYSQSNLLQPGIEDGDTSVRTKDFDTTGVESTVEVAVDGTVIANIYQNRLEVADIKIQDNEISTNISNQDLKLSAPGVGSVLVKDSFVLDATPWDNDAGSNPSVPSSGVKFYARDTANTEGNTGLFFVNSNSDRDEIISKNRALLFSMLF